jgi:hypothetical protein
MKYLLISTIPLLTLGCARHHLIRGSVVGRNGEPVERVLVSLEPGGVEVVTDEQGAFLIDYVRNPEGERKKLSKRTNYTLSAYKAGFHDQAMEFYFKRGELTLEPLSLTADSIVIKPGEDSIDPKLYPDRSQNNGAAYEGE